jgi:hypothetical protein
MLSIHAIKGRTTLFAVNILATCFSKILSLRCIPQLR